MGRAASKCKEVPRQKDGMSALDATYALRTCGQPTSADSERLSNERRGSGVDEAQILEATSIKSGWRSHEPHDSELRKGWTTTGGSSECGPLFQEGGEELRKSDSIFFRKVRLICFYAKFYVFSLA